MVEQGQKYKVKGLLVGVDINNPPDKEWMRASFKIDVGDGKIKTLSTFNEDDIKSGQKALNGEVEITYTKDKTGKYNNMTKGGMTVVGQGETPITEEEIIEESEPVVEEEPVQEEDVDKKYNVKKMDSDPSTKKTTATPIYDSNSYWKAKFEWDVKTNDERQLAIIRQSCLSNAVKLAETSVKAVDLGILSKEEFGNKDLYPKEIFDIAEKMVNWVRTGKKE